MHPGELLYENAVRLLIPALRVAAPFHAKLRRGVSGRDAALGSLESWARTSRDATRPLVWLHAPSVGEALMAQAILAAVRERVPGMQSVFTYFSPSAERVAGRIGADWSGYLPWDTRTAMQRAIDCAKPAVIAFVRTEIWPVLVREALERGVASVLVNAVLADGSSRTSAGARALLGHAYASLDAVGAVSDADAARFPLLGVRRERVHVTGDARFDQVWQRITSRNTAPFVKPSGLCLVAGSTWAADEERLMPALAAQRGVWRAVIAPHEPTAEHLEGLERRLSAARLSFARLPSASGVPLPDADVIVVDRVGVLADLYAIGDAAYVGGGFGRAGLHSVIEPAAFGLPCIYGPAHGSAREAGVLREAGGGDVARDRAEIETALTRLSEAGFRATAGAAARTFVESRLGGAARNAELIVPHLERG